MQVISDYAKIDKGKWSGFVKNHPSGNIFQTPEMWDVYKKTNNYEPVIICVVDNQNNLLASLLAVIQKEYSGILGLLTARSIIFGAPIISNDNPGVFEILIKEYNRIIERKVIYSQVRNYKIQSPARKKFFNQYGFNYEEHLNIIIDLRIGTNALWKGIKRNRKDGINKGKKQGFVFKVYDQLDSVDEFYNLFCDLYKKIKLPHPDISLFNAINDNLANSVKWFILEYKEKPCIILCSFVYNKTIYAFSIGVTQDKELLRLRPVDLFYWEVIKWGAENSYHFFDWMGAGKPNKEYGVRDFKLQYGGELFSLGRYEKIHKPLLNKFAMFSLNIWRKFK